VLLTRRPDTIPSHESGKARITYVSRPAIAHGTGQGLPQRTSRRPRHGRPTNAATCRLVRCI
jgi:hypothetical protein